MVETEQDFCIVSLLQAPGSPTAEKSYCKHDEESDQFYFESGKHDVVTLEESEAYRLKDYLQKAMPLAILKVIPWTELTE